MNRPNIPVLCALLFAAAAPGGAEPLSVTVSTRDGNSLVGTTELASFKMETSLGTMDVKLADVSDVRYRQDGASAVVRMRDGTSLQGKIAVEAWPVKTKLGDLQLKAANLESVVVSVPAAARVQPSPYPQPQPYGGAPGAAPAGPAIAPLKTLSLKASVGALLPSPDGASLYALNTSDGKLLVVSAASLETSREVALPAGTAALSLAPGGKTLVAAGKKTVSVIDPAAGKVTKSFDVEFDLADVYAADEHTVYATTTGNGFLVVISVPKQAVVSKVQGVAGSLRPAPDGRKLYAGGGAVLLPGSGAKGAAGDPAWAPFSGGGYGSSIGDFAISPDGKFAVATSGGVYRLGRSYLADMLPAGKVEPHQACAFLQKAKRALLFTSAGFIKDYEIGSFELGKSIQLGLRVTSAVVDEAKRTMVVFGAPVAGGAYAAGYNPGYSSYQARVVAPGDLYKFALPEGLATPDKPAPGGEAAPVVAAPAKAGAAEAQAPAAGTDEEKKKALGKLMGEYDALRRRMRDDPALEKDAATVAKKDALKNEMESLMRELAGDDRAKQGAIAAEVVAKYAPELGEAMKGARASAEGALCGNNLRQLFLGMHIYASKLGQGAYPPHTGAKFWRCLAGACGEPGKHPADYARNAPLAGSDGVLKCPSAVTPPGSVDYLGPRRHVKVPAADPSAVSDACPLTLPIAADKKGNHPDGGNVLFFDGSVKFLAGKEYEDALKALQ